MVGATAGTTGVQREDLRRPTVMKQLKGLVAPFINMI